VDFSSFEKEFDDSVSKGWIPDIKKELKHFAINPFTREKLTIDTLLDIYTFDDNNEAIFEEKVRIVNNVENGTFDFYEVEGNKLIAKTPQTVTLNPESYFCTKLFKEEKAKLIQASSGKDSTFSEKDP